MFYQGVKRSLNITEAVRWKVEVQNISIHTFYFLGLVTGKVPHDVLCTSLGSTSDNHYREKIIFPRVEVIIRLGVTQIPEYVPNNNRDFLKLTKHDNTLILTHLWYHWMWESQPQIPRNLIYSQLVRFWK